MKQYNTPLISIVILNFNGLKHLTRTIPTITKLKHHSYEIIVVDNASIDGSLEFLKTFNSIRIVQNKTNLGYARGKNIGAKKAMGDYILFLDNDILIKDLKLLNKLQKFYSKYKESIISIPFRDSGQKNINYFGGFLYYSIDPLRGARVVDKIEVSQVCYPNGGAFFISKKLWDELGGFDDSQPFNLDDKDLGVHAYLLGYKVILFDGVILEHLGHSLESFDLRYWCWKYQYHYSGIMRLIIKNFKVYNIFIYGVTFTISNFADVAKNSMKLSSLAPAVYFLKSVKTFLKSLPDTLEKRREIQSQRKLKNDYFLKLRPNYKI